MLLNINLFLALLLMLTYMAYIILQKFARVNCELTSSLCVEIKKNIYILYIIYIYYVYTIFYT